MVNFPQRNDELKFTLLEYDVYRLTEITPPYEDFQTLEIQPQPSPGLADETALC